MADLSANTTVGGRIVWTQGNFPLYPAGNSLFYNSSRVYTENDKPQASNNDFVSKQNGGVYQSTVTFNNGISITAPGGQNGIYAGSGDDASQNATNLDIKSWQGIGFYNSCTNSGYQGRTVWINVRTGELTTYGNIYSQQNIISQNGPTAANHVTRKDYVDNLYNQAVSNANSRVARSGDTMTGQLIAPNFISQNNATSGSQVPRFDQVIAKGTIIDFGTF